MQNFNNLSAAFNKFVTFDNKKVQMKTTLSCYLNSNNPIIQS